MPPRPGGRRPHWGVLSEIVSRHGPAGIITPGGFWQRAGIVQTPGRFQPGRALGLCGRAASFSPAVPWYYADAWQVFSMSLRTSDRCHWCGNPRPAEIGKNKQYSGRIRRWLRICLGYCFALCATARRTDCHVPRPAPRNDVQNTEGLLRLQGRLARWNAKGGGASAVARRCCWVNPQTGRNLPR